MGIETIKPRVLLVAGPNGSGKTTITERGLAHEWFDGCENVNPDLIARDEFGDWNSPQAILQAADLAQARLVLRAAEGRIIRMYREPPPWMLPIIAELQA